MGGTRQRRASFLTVIVRGGVSDVIAPTVASFTVASPSISLDIPIAAFTASEVGASFIITESATPPAVDAAGWAGTAPTTYTVATQGTKTLYPWVKDAAGNVSSVYGSPASVTVILYQLIDRFTTARAAGAINGTPAEPGGTDAPNRVVSDVGNKATIANGEFTVASGAGVDTPTLTYSQSYARSAGLVMAAKCYITLSGLGRFLFGWSAAATGKTYTHRHYIDSGNILSIAGFCILVNEITRDAPHFLALVLRASGCYHFIYSSKPGGMILLHIDRVGTTTPLYPAWTHYDTAAVPTDDFVIPTSTYNPTALISDDFNRADGAPANGWTDRLGTSAIATNVLTFSALDGVGDGIVTRESGKVNHVTIAKLTRAGGNIGIVTRYADANNYVKTYHDGTNVVIVKVVGGTPSTVASVAVAYSAGKDLEVIWGNSTSIRVMYNNTQLGADAYTISDAGLLTGTQVGIYSTDTGNTADDFESHARGTGDEHSELKMLVVRPQTKKLVMFDGDSLSAGDGVAATETMPYQTETLLGRTTYDYYKIAIGGQTMVDCDADAATQIDSLAGVWADDICVIWAGTNDLATGATAADTYAVLLSYVQARQAAGYKVAVITMVKRTTSGALETKRGAYNTLISANTAGANAIIDAGAAAELQNVTNATYYQGDQTHLTAAGYAIVAGLVNTAVAAL